MKTLTKPSKATKATPAAQLPAITDNPDGSFDLHGECADRVRAEATARGITPDEYADLAIQRGLAIMEERREKLPIYLPAPAVQFLNEVCAAAEITAEAFVQAVIGDMIEDSLAGDKAVEGLIAGLWDHADEEPAASAMQAAVDRWKSKAS